MSTTQIVSLSRSAVIPTESGLSVGDVRSVDHEDIATGVVDTGTGSDDTVMKVTWADVVKRPAATTSKVTIVKRQSCGQDLAKRRKFVSGSFSRNNPVNRKV